MPISQFDFHGSGVQVASVDEGFLQSVEHDFSYFLAPAPQPSLQVTYERACPDYDRLPDLTCSLATPRNICFSDERATYIDYFGRALNTYERAANRCTIVSDDPDLAHEIGYLTILSRVSEALERRRLHRIHGLGLELRGKGVVVLLPSGGGKSTLALSLLGQDADVRLLSEDSPLVRRDGHLLPFPLRIGVHPQNVPPDIDASFTRRDRRMEFAPKVNIDIRCFGDRICRQPVPAAALLLGVRSTGRQAHIAPVARRAFVRHALMNSVIGIGLYQGLEFLLQRNLRDAARHARLLLSRVRANAALLRRAQVYRFVIGRDGARNAECLREFLRGPGVR